MTTVFAWICVEFPKLANREKYRFWEKPGTSPRNVDNGFTAAYKLFPGNTSPQKKP